MFNFFLIIFKKSKLIIPVLSKPQYLVKGLTKQLFLCVDEI